MPSVTGGNSVTSSTQLATDVVTLSAMADDSVDASNIKPGVVASSEITNDSIVNEDINSAAAIDDSKLAQINDADKVHGSAMTNLDSIPSDAGQIPSANLPPAIKFGGDGSNGALNVTSGTTTIDLASANTKVLNYTTINISAGATLAFSNPATSGSVVIIKSSTGTVTIAGTINASSLGSAGGNSGSGASGTAGTTISPTILMVSGGATSGGGATNPTTGGIAGVASTSPYFYINSTYSLALKKPVMLMCGTGGGGGGGNGTNGAGGRGGGALYIEVAGSWDFTGTINTSGAAGSSGSYSGGGGGGAGMLCVLYNTLVASSGTHTNNSGAGGSGGSGGNSGGGGGGASALGAGGAGATASGAGTAGTNGGGGGGGSYNGSAGGASSTSASLSLITKNYYFA